MDLTTDVINVTKVKSRTQQEEYIGTLKAPDRPDFKKKSGAAIPIDSMTEKDFEPQAAAPTKRAKVHKASPRTTIIPKTCKLNITANAKIEKIFNELRVLQLKSHVHAIGVLLRVFLEMSVDHYLVSIAKSGLTFQSKGGHQGFKKLDAKVKETIEYMVKHGGATESDFKGVQAGMLDEHHPFSIDTLHAYIHNRFFTPTEGNLTTGWDNAQKFFETIWP